MVTYGFHPEALAEYSAAAARRLQEGSPQVAEAFVSSVESAVQTIISDPARCESSRSQAFDVTFYAVSLTSSTTAGKPSAFMLQSTLSCIAVASLAIGRTGRPNGNKECRERGIAEKLRMGHWRSAANAVRARR